MMLRRPSKASPQSNWPAKRHCVKPPAPLPLVSCTESCRDASTRQGFSRVLVPRESGMPFDSAQARIGADEVIWTNQQRWQAQRRGIGNGRTDAKDKTAHRRARLDAPFPPGPMRQPSDRHSLGQIDDHHEPARLQLVRQHPAEERKISQGSCWELRPATSSGSRVMAASSGPAVVVAPSPVTDTALATHSCQ